MASTFGTLGLVVNQRSAPRVVFHRKAHLVGVDGRPIPVKTFDISTGGVGIMSPHPVETREICSLNIFTLHNAMPELSVKGMIAYCMLSGTQGYRIGLQYTEAPPNVKSLISQVTANALL